MAITQPDPAILQRMYSLMEPWHALTRPQFTGMDNIPEQRPLIFVGNHTIWGIFDTPILLMELYRRRALALRALGDHVHWMVPGWRDLLTGLGVVHGTPDAAHELLAAGEAILIFPGGGREVAKRRGEKYRLLWKQRTGFARLAVRHGCAIVPFSAVGGEEMLDIVYDAEDLLASKLGPLVRRLPIRTDVIIPMARGVGGLPIPRPERLYFHFGRPIYPPKDAINDAVAATTLRDQVQDAVMEGLIDLHGQRSRDPLRHLPNRLAAAALDTVVDVAASLLSRFKP